MARNYDHRAIEKKWQAEWAKQKLYETPDSVPKKENLYALVEFPYPSGDLHVGHWYAYAVPDAFVRMKRMQGYNVLFPFGYDAFGLPAENAAIKRNINPAEWIKESVEKMGAQIKTMGNAFDWSREVNTSSPDYYKWTQWLFLQFYKKGLAYRGKGKVNWCPNDQTVLANEQVIEGKCERCDAEVVQKDMEQWFMKITDYADRLLEDLEPLDWPNAIKDSQRNWIGRSEGAEIEFPISNSQLSVKVFTTRPDTLYGATYVVLAPEHPLIEKLSGTTVNWSSVKKYVDDAKKKTELTRMANKEKTGVCLEGITAINPASKEAIPVYVADYVLGGYGTGAIMAVPAHDERDFEFAKKFNLPIRAVIKHENEYRDIDQDKQIAFLKDLYSIASENDGTMVVIGGIARSALVEKKGSFHHSDIDLFVTKDLFVELETYLLNNGFVEEKEKSLDKYHWKNKKAFSFKSDKSIWIDLFLLEAEGENYFDNVTGSKFAWNDHGKILETNFSGIAIKIPDKNLLERIYQNMASTVEYLGNDVGIGILTQSGQFDGLTSEEAKKKITEFVGGKLTKTYKFRDWLVSRQRYWGAPIPIVYDPEGKAHPIPEEHLPWLLPKDADIKPKGTSPLGSSKELIERTEKIFGKGWRPETDTMDGFVDNSWYFLRYIDPKNDKEFSSLEQQKNWMPIARYSGGAEHTTVHVLYSRFFVKALYDMGLATVSEPYTERMNRGIILAEDGRKMSKRWGNVVNPDEQVATVGADAVRMYLAFIGPYNEVGSFPWNTNSLIGVRRFLERVADLSDIVEIRHRMSNLETEVLLNQSIKKVGEDIESMKFNTSVSQLMILSNHFIKTGSVSKTEYEIFLRLLAPFAPHLTEELWHELGHKTSIHLESWPSFDASKLETDTSTVAVQMNGKTRGTVVLSRGASEAEAVAAVRKDVKIGASVPSAPKRVVYIPGKIVNFIA